MERLFLRHDLRLDFISPAAESLLITVQDQLIFSTNNMLFFPVEDFLTNE